MCNENKDTISESLIKTPFQEELQAMFYFRNDRTYSLNDIDADYKIKGTSITVSDPRTWLETRKPPIVRLSSMVVTSSKNDKNHPHPTVIANSI